MWFRPPIKVARMVRSDTHFYSILLTRDGFEYVFRSGHDHWSTISHKHGKKIIERDMNGESGRPRANSMKEFLALASHGASSKRRARNSGWQVKKLIKYSSRDQALQVETRVLDKSWELMEKGRDHE